MHDPRGSIWRKWDLHFHTPSSYDYLNKSITNQEIVDNLLKAGINVIVVTDHHKIDVSRIIELQKLGGDKLTVLPGIELRSELGGSESIHFIGIFPEDIDLNDIWLKLQAKLNITPKDVKIRGDDAIYTVLRDAANLIHKDFGGIVSIHAGKKSNSIENISNKEFFKMALKKDLVKDYVDIFEIGGVSDIESYETIVFPAINRYIPLVIGSDNHYATKYSIKASCWIKADPCFRGLKQILIEPKERIYIGNTPNKIITVSNNKTKYISGIQIFKNTESEYTDEIWFNNNILMNHGLVAIIGNKGSGKSALADIIGLVGNSKKQEWFPFLNSKQFRIPSGNKAEHFFSKLIWESGVVEERGLNSDIDRNQIERVKYIPQNFFEVICNELAEDEEGDFDKELREVIFTHVSDLERLGTHSLNDLLSYKTGETNEAIDYLRTQLSILNGEIAEVEAQLTVEYRQSICNKLHSKKEELEIHDSNKPQKLKKPRGLDKKNQEMLLEIESFKEERDLLQQFLDIDDEKRNRIAIIKSGAEKVLDKIRNFERQYENLKLECEEYLEDLKIDISDILTLETNETLLVDSIDQLSDELEAINSVFDQGIEDSIASRIIYLEKNIDTIQNNLSDKHEEYHINEQKLKEWEDKRFQIVGTSDHLDSVKYYEGVLQGLDNLPTQLLELKKKRTSIVMDIYSHIEKLADTYRKLYQPVQNVISSHHLAKGKFSLNFDVSIVCSNFDIGFFEWISHSFVGTFHGVDEGNKTLENIINKYNFNSSENISRFLDEIIENLTHDRRTDFNADTRIIDQMKKGKENDLNSFYDFLFALDYLKPRYVLKMSDKELNQLSPGEKGTLLLIFYLLVDKADIPLIIDQPELNLDNQTVYDVLVPCIKEAKQRRQIIIVTHNPNLAVVCDADQIICATLDKQDKNRISYCSGSIENPDINKRIVDILEGTRPAFDNRDAKYIAI